MILGIDVGNTHTVLGLIEDRTIVGRWRIATNPTLTADELRVTIGGLLAMEGHAWSEVERIVLSSVVPALTVRYEEVAQRLTGERAMVIGPGIKTGMPIRYDNPHEVGADRIVNGVAAYAEHGGPVIVVDFGTATTLDVIDAEGAYLGGAIAPGVETSAEALFSRAARIAKVDLEPPSRVIGTNTRASVQAGLLLGEAAMVDGLVRRAWEELGGPCLVVATGGLARRMAPLCETIEVVDEDLTVKGLILIHERNV